MCSVQVHPRGREEAVSRLIVPYPSEAAATRGVAPAGGDNAAGRLVKYIPGEIISGYMLLSGLIEVAPQGSNFRLPLAWVIFALGVVLTPAYLYKVAKPVGVQRWQLLISTGSFVLWAYALGGPFKMGPPVAPGYGYEGWLGAVLAGAYSWAVALCWQPTQSD
jgi:hypothetical protein